MPRKIDIHAVIGQRFGNMIVIALYDTYKGSYRYTCKCDCGEEFLALRARIVGQSPYPAVCCKKCSLKKVKRIMRNWSNDSNYQKAKYNKEKLPTIDGWHIKYVKKSE